MEFVSYDDAIQLLGEAGVVASSKGPDRLELDLDSETDRVHVRVTCEGAAGCCPELAPQGCTTVAVAKERLPELLEALFHKMRVQQLLVLPIGKWRNIFDAVAFSMAEVEEWQEVDATASVSLNTRDPLLCEPPDLHTLRALLGAILANAEGAEQGVLITTTVTPILVELHPCGCVHFTVTTPALASTIEKTLES